LNLFDGRRELNTEIAQSTPALRQYISNEISKLLKYRDFDYAVQSCAQGDTEREALIFQRLEQVIEGKD